MFRHTEDEYNKYHKLLRLLVGFCAPMETPTVCASTSIHPITEIMTLVTPYIIFDIECSLQSRSY
jgi:hypothetical protein